MSFSRSRSSVSCYPFPEGISTNVLVERLWRTVKQEEVYVKGYHHVADCREGLQAYVDRYNNLREHQSLDFNYPAEIYFGDTVLKQAA